MNSYVFSLSSQPQASTFVVPQAPPQIGEEVVLPPKFFHYDHGHGMRPHPAVHKVVFYCMQNAPLCFYFTAIAHAIKGFFHHVTLSIVTIIVTILLYQFLVLQMEKVALFVNH